VAGETHTHQHTNKKIDPPPPTQVTQDTPKKIFYSLEFVDIKSRRRYGRISYEKGVRKED
jgi:hypothetical protein